MYLLLDVVKYFVLFIDNKKGKGRALCPLKFAETESEHD